jgi:hypothetical protein
MDYVDGLVGDVAANCWQLAEAAGHGSPRRMQDLLGSYAWDWRDVGAELPGFAAAHLPCPEGDIAGAGLAIDETAHLKNGTRTAGVTPPVRGDHRPGRELRHHRVLLLRDAGRALLGRLGALPARALVPGRCLPRGGARARGRAPRR